MSKVTREVWHCDDCGWEWIPATDGEPERCPKTSCRSRHWNKNAEVPKVKTEYRPIPKEKTGEKIELKRCPHGLIFHAGCR